MIEIIERVVIECDEISLIETKRMSLGKIIVTLENVYNDFINEIDVEEIVFGQDVEKILDAIGVEEVADWLKGKGSL